MTNKLIARHKECGQLQRCLQSDQSEFVIVYGRRRIGKTFLIEQFFNKKYDFKFVGGHKLSCKAQLANFAKALRKYAKVKINEFNSWSDAFDALEEYLESLPSDRKKVVFFDEMPWIDTQRSDFVSSLEYFWNSWAASQEDILFVATGSSTSWMVENLIENQGGLHNRITESIYLRPFTLGETEEYLVKRRFPKDRYQTLQFYMLTGGVPYYLSLLEPRDSVAQNIDRLCFDPRGKLRMEFDELYNALFSNAQTYINVVKVLAENKSGLTRKEISEKTKISGSTLTGILKNLERSDFIDKRLQYGNKKKDSVYRLIDFYTLFYYKFLESDGTRDYQWWTHNISSQSILSWMGLTFELICLEHHEQIKKGLGIGGMATSVSTWRHVADKNDMTSGAQVDMVIERADRIIHLFEMKFSTNKFKITKEYEKKIRERLWLFQEITKTTKAVVQTFVTTYGLSNPTAWSIVHSELTMDDLFT